MSNELDQDLVIRSLTTDDLDLFATVTATAPEAADWHTALVRGLDQGHTQPEWCFVATRQDAEGALRVTGRVSHWGFRDSGTPFVIWHADWASPDAVAVLVAAQRALSPAEPVAEFVLPPGQHPTTDRATQHGVLVAAGFTLDLERLEIGLDATDAPVQPVSDRLTFAAARDLPRPDVVEMIARIDADTVDYRTRLLIERHGLRQHAEDVYDDLMNADAEPDWFEIGFRGGEPVGLVVPCRSSAGRGRCSINFIGVMPEHRGNRYVDDLLARGTATLLAAGAGHIEANADAANSGSSSAFTRAGYDVVGRVYQYFWKRG